MSGYYQRLMYAGLRTSETLHKKTFRIGSEICATSLPANAESIGSFAHEVDSRIPSRIVEMKIFLIKVQV